MSPLITVLMPVYDGERHLAEAIESILGQSFGDFELLIVDDGSTDRSAEICRSYQDARIRLVQNPTNLGIVQSLNRGLDLAVGAYVARMDADDIALPERLEKQILTMEARPEVGVCGTGISIFGAHTHPGSIPWTDPGLLRGLLVFDNPLAHPTVMLRSEVLTRFGLRYDARYTHAEDYELWTRCARHTEICNVPEILLGYRTHERQTTHVHARAQADLAKSIRRGQLGALGIQPSAYEEALHLSVVRRPSRPRERHIEAVRAWLARLDAANHLTRHVPEEAFKLLLTKLLARMDSAMATLARDDGRGPTTDPARPENDDDGPSADP